MTRTALVGTGPHNFLNKQFTLMLAVRSNSIPVFYWWQLCKNEICNYWKELYTAARFHDNQSQIMLQSTHDLPWTWQKQNGSKFCWIFPGCVDSDGLKENTWRHDKLSEDNSLSGHFINFPVYCSRVDDLDYTACRSWDIKPCEDLQYEAQHWQGRFVRSS